MNCSNDYLEIDYLLIRFKKFLTTNRTTLGIKTPKILDTQAKKITKFATKTQLPLQRLNLILQGKTYTIIFFPSQVDGSKKAAPVNVTRKEQVI